MSLIEFQIIELSENGGESRGSRSFQCRPHVGDHVEFSADDEKATAKIWQVVEIALATGASGGAGDLYVIEVGTTPSWVKSLKERHVNPEFNWPKWWSEHLEKNSQSLQMAQNIDPELAKLTEMTNAARDQWANVFGSLMRSPSGVPTRKEVAQLAFTTQRVVEGTVLGYLTNTRLQINRHVDKSLSSDS